MNTTTSILVSFVWIITKIKLLVSFRFRHMSFWFTGMFVKRISIHWTICYTIFVNVSKLYNLYSNRDIWFLNSQTPSLISQTSMLLILSFIRINIVKPNALFIIIIYTSYWVHGAKLAKEMLHQFFFTTISLKKDIINPKYCKYHWQSGHLKFWSHFPLLNFFTAINKILNIEKRNCC